MDRFELTKLDMTGYLNFLLKKKKSLVEVEYLIMRRCLSFHRSIKILEQLF